MREGLTPENIKKAFKEYDLEKARYGIYEDNPENKRLGRIGQEYGHKRGKEENDGISRKVLNNYDTKEKHSKDGIYSRHRAKVHNTLKKELLSNAVISDKPVVTLVMGGAAGGKGTASKLLRSKKDDSERVVLDVDNIKKVLPEYEHFSKEKAAANVHEESSDVGKNIRGDIIDNKISFVNDATLGDKEKAIELVKKLQAAGYTIKLIAVTTDIDESKRREQARYERTGRRVPEDIIEDTHMGGVAAYEAIKGMVNDFTLLDNNVKKDTPPIIIDNSKDGIVDKGKYQDFLNKKNYIKASKRNSKKEQ